MRLFILFAICLLLCPIKTDAGLFDNVLDKGKTSAEEMVKDKAQEAVGNQKNKTSTKSMPGRTGTQPKTAPAKTTLNANDYRSVPSIMKRWPYEGNTGKSVRHATIRGLHLGMPLPEAVKLLEANNFSLLRGRDYQQLHYQEKGKRKIASRKAYYAIPGGKRGQILRSITISLTTAVPSAEILKELPAFPESSQSSGTPKNRNQMKSMDEATRKRMQSRMDRLSRSSSKPRPVKKEYITGITFAQKSMSGENVDGDALFDAARKNYGKPTYTIAQTSGHATKGAAYGVLAGGLWYYDSALESKQTVEALVAKSGLDDRTMVFDDFIHPGRASNAYYIRAYDNLKDRVAALRIARAPYMHVKFKGAAFVVDLQWPFLKAEREYRQLWEKQQAQEKKPAADVQF